MENKNPCLGCGCYDPDMGYTMSSIDMCYACSLETNKETFEDWE